MPPSVSSSAVPFSFALPSSSIAPAVNPLLRLIELTPNVSIVYCALLTGLVLYPVATAIALIVSLVLTATGPVYFVLEVVGVLPSVV